MTPPEESRERVRQVVEEAVARIDTPEAAEAVIERVERLARGATEAEKADQAAQAPLPPAAAVEAAASRPRPVSEAAAVLTTAAAEAVAPTPEAPAVLAGARDVLAPHRPAAPAARQGQALLLEALLRRMGRLQALDTRLYLAVNSLPHTPAVDRAFDRLTFWSTGGWIWAGGVAAAGLLGVPRTGYALRLLLPTVAGATWIVEHPLKMVFRRQRPFIDVVRALVVGKRPGSWSFPSGHTAASFAAAWVLSTLWPRRAPFFFLLAWSVGASRVYVGAHYPGDVSSGALLGMALAEGLRRLLRATLLPAPRRRGLTGRRRR